MVFGVVRCFARNNSAITGSKKKEEVDMAIGQLGTAVAELLPGDWEVVKATDSFVTLSEGAAKLYLHEFGTSPGRVEITVDYPQFGRSSTRPESRRNKPLRATVAISRGPGAVAKAITRRILPEYLPEMEDCVALYQKWEQNSKVMDRLLQSVNEVLGNSPNDSLWGNSELKARHTTAQFHLSGTYTGRVAVRIDTPTSLHLEISSIGPQEAMEVLWLLRYWHDLNSEAFGEMSKV
jgi:hypothetical protein